MRWKRYLKIFRKYNFLPWRRLWQPLSPGRPIFPKVSIICKAPSKILLLNDKTISRLTVATGAPIIDLSLAPPTHLLLDIQIHVSWGTRLIDLGLAEGCCDIFLCCQDNNLLLRHLSNLDLALSCSSMKAFASVSRRSDPNRPSRLSDHLRVNVFIWSEWQSSKWLDHL